MVKELMVDRDKLLATWTVKDFYDEVLMLAWKNHCEQELHRLYRNSD